MKISKTGLLLSLAFSILFSTNLFAAKAVKSKGYNGDSKGYVGGAVRTEKSHNGGISIGFAACVTTVDKNTGKVTKKIFGFFKTRDDATRAANSAARKEAGSDLRGKKKMSKKESQNMWQKFVGLFKKKKKGDGVMLNEDGEGDVVIGGTWPQPGEHPDIIFSN